MRLIPSDPDVATIYGRINGGDLNLRPDFQRGEVWSPAKKQKLIDSILREWHIPPVHIIRGTNGREDEVLDGQQRLVSIRDFIEGKLRINGAIEPIDESIAELHGLRFDQLPSHWRRKVLQFPVRVFSIVDFSPAEPSELFYRLNQPASLTAAEQRNSFFGKPREQIKALVIEMEAKGLNKEFLGFSNSRMAYDDVLARVCVALEEGLGAKLSANLLADRYRSDLPFSEEAYSRVKRAIDFFSALKTYKMDIGKLNKATLFSWLMFICRLLAGAPNVDIKSSAAFLGSFEPIRVYYQFTSSDETPREKICRSLYEIYWDRATSRVADVSSVLLRDVAMWGLFMAFNDFRTPFVSESLNYYEAYLLSTEDYDRGIAESDLLEFVFTADFEWERIE